MFEKMAIFRMAQGLATHAAARQVVISRNIANADTPGYKAMDIAPFAETYDAEGALRGPDMPLRTTRPGHIAGGMQGRNVPGGGRWQPHEADRPGQMSPDGNNVSLETEMMLAADVRQEHETALAVYRSALDIMRASLGRR